MDIVFVLRPYLIHILTWQQQQQKIFSRITGRTMQVHGKKNDRMYIVDNIAYVLLKWLLLLHK